MKQIVVAATIALLLAACGPNQGPKQTLGTIIGGVGGAMIGNEVGKGRGRKVAIAAGTLLGAMLGSRLGRDLDEADRITAARTTQGALERGRTGDRVAWKNPDSGNSGWVEPTRTWQESSGRYCREFQTGIIIGGEEQTGYGTACRQPDGSWKIVQPAA